MLGIVATIVCSVSLLLNIVGVAIPFWEYASNPSVYYGLWKICVGLNSSAFAPDYTNVCLSLDKILTVPDSLKVVRAFELLGMLLLFASLVIAGPTLVLKKYQNARKLTVGLATSSGVLMVIGAYIYAVKTQNEIDPKHLLDLHVSFGLCITAGCLAVVSGIMFCFTAKPKQTPRPRTQPRTIHEGVSYSVRTPTRTPVVVISPPYYRSDSPLSSASEKDSVSSPEPYYCYPGPIEDSEEEDVKIPSPIKEEDEEEDEYFNDGYSATSGTSRQTTEYF